MKAIFKRAVPYAKDAMNLPVADVEAAFPFYEDDGLSSYAARTFAASTRCFGA